MEESKMTFTKKAEHIWFYYKWYIIVGSLFALLTIVCCVQCAKQTSYDMKITFVATGTNAKLTESACEEIMYFIKREYVEDQNDDGELNMTFTRYGVSSSFELTDKTVQQALTISIYNTETFLFICDETGYNHLKSIGSGNGVNVLEPLDCIDGITADDDIYRVSLKGTRLGELKTINEQANNELYACLRVYTGSSAEKDGAATKRYNNALKVLCDILADRVE